MIKNVYLPVIAIWMLIASALYPCCDMRDTTMKNQDIAKKLPYVLVDGQLVQGFTVYTIDSCEYIGQGIGSQNGVLSHKGNCSFCDVRGKRD